MSESPLTNPNGQSFADILNIVKALGNEKRLQILTNLLNGPQSFDALKTQTQLKKTALSNHLTILTAQELITKPEHGKYQPTADAKLFLQHLEAAYNKSTRWQKNQFSTQTRQSSAPFINAIFSQTSPPKDNQTKLK